MVRWNDGSGRIEEGWDPFAVFLDGGCWEQMIDFILSVSIPVLRSINIWKMKGG